MNICIGHTLDNLVYTLFLVHLSLQANILQFHNAHNVEGTHFFFLIAEWTRVQWFPITWTFTSVSVQALWPGPAVQISTGTLWLKEVLWNMFRRQSACQCIKDPRIFTQISPVKWKKCFIWKLMKNKVGGKKGSEFWLRKICKRGSSPFTNLS